MLRQVVIVWLGLGMVGAALLWVLIGDRVCASRPRKMVSSLGMALFGPMMLLPFACYVLDPAATSLAFERFFRHRPNPSRLAFVWAIVLPAAAGLLWLWAVFTPTTLAP